MKKKKKSTNKASHKEKKGVNYIFGLYLIQHILIWYITFQYCVNLVIVVIFWMEITDVITAKIKKLVFVDVIVK